MVDIWIQKSAALGPLKNVSKTIWDRDPKQGWCKMHQRPARPSDSNPTSTAVTLKPWWQRWKNHLMVFLMFLEVFRASSMFWRKNINVPFIPTWNLHLRGLPSVINHGIVDLCIFLLLVYGEIIELFTVDFPFRISPQNRNITGRKTPVSKPPKRVVTFRFTPVERLRTPKSSTGQSSFPYSNPPTPLWRWRRAYWGAHSNTKCSMTFVNIAVAISALAGGGGAKTVSHRDQTPKTVSHRDQPMVVFSTFFEDFWVSERKRVLKWNFGSFW